LTFELHETWNRPVAIDLTQALFQSRTRAALLKAVLRDAVSDSLSGLARRTGLSQHAVAVEVKNLAAAGLVRVESLGGADVVHANREHPAVEVLVRLLAVAEASSPPEDDVRVRESLAHFGAPLRSCRRRRHFTLETTLAKGLVAARKDSAVLESLAIVLLKNRSALDWSVVREEARILKQRNELRALIELAADASGQAELKVQAADLEDRRRKVHSFRVDDAVRASLRKALARAGLASQSAARANAAERERVRRMSGAERALLALDLGERFRAFRRERP
jgi:hypothetical protein